VAETLASIGKNAENWYTKRMIEYQTTDASRPRVYLDATLRRDCSFSRADFPAFMRWVTGVCLAIGLLFYWKGAWPVIGFMGLDVLLIWLAFKTYFRQQEQQYERILLDEYGLHIEKHHRGHCLELELEPTFLQPRLEHAHQSHPLRLYTRGTFEEIGSLLGLPEKQALLEKLKEALSLRKECR